MDDKDLSCQSPMFIREGTNDDQEIHNTSSASEGSASSLPQLSDDRTCLSYVENFLK